MKRLSKPESTTVDFPDAWAAQPFADHEAAVLRDDNGRLELSMRLAVRVRYVHDSKRFKEAGHDTFEEWCESIDRTKQWGHYLVKAADHAGRVANARQARVLTGLSPADSDAVVAAAASAGPVTTQTLTEARAATVQSNRQAANEITEAMCVRKVLRQLEKAKLEMQKTTVFSERDYADVERIIAACKSQLDEGQNFSGT